MNYYKLYLSLVMLFIAGCSPSNEVPFYNLKQPYTHDLDSTKFIDDTVRKFSETYGFKIEINETWVSTRGSNGVPAFNYWLMRKNKPNITITSLSQQGYYILNMYESGFNNLEELEHYKDKLFYSLKIQEQSIKPMGSPKLQ